MTTARRLGWVVLAVTAACVALVSTLQQSAARMLAWPWCSFYLAACMLPWVYLAGSGVRCAWAATCRFRGIKLAVLLGCGATLATGLSPFRSQLWVWLVVPWGAIGTFVLVSHLYVERSRSEGAWLVRTMSILGTGVGLSSVMMWLSTWVSRGAFGDDVAQAAGLIGRLSQLLGLRNTEPLGHANYLAGAGVLFLPWSMALVYSDRRWRLLGWTGVVLLCLMLVSASSRGGLVGVVIVVLIAFLILVGARAQRRALLGRALLVTAVIALVACLHPGLRSALRPRSDSDQPNMSNVERQTFLSIAWHAGLDRPVSGWGIGGVPLFYDRFRGREPYGSVNMLQVHNTPANLWAEGGLIVIGAAGALFGLLVMQAWRLRSRICADREPVLVASVLSLAGYAAFSVTDYQLDLPLIGLALAVGAGVLTSSESVSDRISRGVIARWLGSASALLVVVAMAVIGIPWCRAKQLLHEGRIDEALAVQSHDATIRVMRAHLGAERARALAPNDPRAAEALRNAAVVDLNSALQEGGHVEVAEFALGWLMLDTNPAASRRAFDRVHAVAHSRRGVWLGTALAELRLGRADAAPALLVEECLANPSFLGSGWWLTNELRPHRAAVLDLLARRLEGLANDSTRRTWARHEAADFCSLVRCVAGQLTESQLSELLRDAGRREKLGLILGDGSSGPAPERLLAASDDRLEAFFERQLGWMLPLGYAAQVNGCVREWPSHGWLSLAFSPRDEDARILVMAYAPMPGFGVRMRNPYAQRIRSVMPESRNVVAECFLDFLLPLPGWIMDNEFSVVEPRAGDHEER